jgi:hypothetical protein
MSDISTSVIIAFAYIYLAIEKLFHLPTYVYIAIFFVVSILATAIALTPAQLAKYQLATSSQSLQDYGRFLLITQASGNDAVAQRVYQNLSPVLQSQPQWMQQDFRDIVFPQERVATLMNFWNMVAAQQPNAREVNAALAILAYQTYQQEKFHHYIATWKQLEPNDSRLEKIKLFSSLFQ